MHGFYGRILKVDLSEKTYSIEAVSDEILEKYLGGKGLASYLLYELNPPGVDSLDPANCLIFATGPVSGSTIWGSSRYRVYSNHPQQVLTQNHTWSPGENLVRFVVIENEYWRTALRTGVGAEPTGLSYVITVERCQASTVERPTDL